MLQLQADRIVQLTTELNLLMQTQNSKESTIQPVTVPCFSLLWHVMMHHKAVPFDDSFYDRVVEVLMLTDKEKETLPTE